MSTFERNAFDFSTFTKSFLQPFQSLGAPAAMQSLPTAALRSQVEIMSFWSRRARAWIETPQRLAACRTVEDLGAEQQRYWQNLVEDCGQSGQRIAEACSAMPQAVAAETRAAPRAEPAARRTEDPEPLAQAPVVADEPASDGGYEWWRTDMKAIMPRRNGHAGHAHS